MRLQMRQKRVENLLFDGFPLGRGLDDQIHRAQIGQRERGADAGHRLGLGLGCGFAARDLPLDVAVDQGQRLGQAVLVHVIQQHIIACQRENMGNPVAHLTCAHDADCPDIHAQPLCVRGSLSVSGGRVQGQRGNCTAFAANPELSILERGIGQGYLWVKTNLGGVMAYAFPGAGALDYDPCQYGTSRLLFRGPGCDLGGEYIAMLGGTETYGKYVQRPFASVVGDALGLPVANLGCMNAGMDAFLQDEAVLEIAAGARAVVVQIMGAQNLSNRYYSVHPRRNDRFLGATPLLRAIFRDVDFTEFHFTRHMLTTLHATSVQRFEVIAEELRAAWVQRMRALLVQIPGPKVLLWMGEAPPHSPSQRADMSLNPLLVDREMIDAVRGEASIYVEVRASLAARDAGTAGMEFAPLEALAASGLPGPLLHQEVAAALVPVLRRFI